MMGSQPDDGLLELLAAQDEWAAVELIRSEVPELVQPAWDRRERALMAALAGGASVCSVSGATGLSAAEITERCERR
jgi:hypothetical protein